MQSNVKLMPSSQKKSKCAFLKMIFDQNLKSISSIANLNRNVWAELFFSIVNLFWSQVQWIPTSRGQRSSEIKVPFLPKREADGDQTVETLRGRHATTFQGRARRSGNK